VPEQVAMLVTRPCPCAELDPNVWTGNGFC
jgi:hypothetical protein